VIRALRRARSRPWVATSLYSLASPICRVARSLQAQLTRRVRRNGGTCQYDGVTLRFPRNVGMGFLSEISWHGTEGFEPNTWRILRSLIEKSGTFIDIGANIGFYSVLAKRVSPDVDVLSFEPIPMLCEQNRAFHRCNQLRSNVRQIALSDGDGLAKLYQPIEDDIDETSASTLAGASWQARQAHRELDVETARLDTLLSGEVLRIPVTLKIDVEDHEAAVLRGAAETIRKFRPFIVCEILPRPFRTGSLAGAEVVPWSEQHGNAETARLIAEMNYGALAITAVGYFRFSQPDFPVDRPFTEFLLVPMEYFDIEDSRSYFRDLNEILEKLPIARSVFC
jgi:FkbM family methyltransferase